MIPEENEIVIGKEDKLLLLCALPDINDKSVSEIKSIIQNNIDWNYVFQKSVEHKLTPMLYWQLKSKCHDLVPKEVMDDLKDFFYKNAGRNLLLLRELLKILEVFKSNNITSVTYKGPTLAILGYKNVSLRVFSDLDILIRKEDALKVKNLLISMNFKLLSQPEKIEDSLYLRNQREYVFRTDKNVNLEIHWNFQGIFLRFPMKTNFIFDELIPLKVGDEKVPSFSMENLALILCVHAAIHNWSQLSQICDLSALIQSQSINWEELIEKSERLNIKRILQINLLLIQNLFGIKIPAFSLKMMGPNDHVAIELSGEIIHNFFENRSLSLYRKIIFQFKKRENLTDGFNDLFRTIFIPTYYDLQDLALPAPLYFLYYFIRPFLLLKRYL